MFLFMDYGERQATTQEKKTSNVVLEGELGHEEIFQTRVAASSIDAESKTDSRRECLSLP